MKFLWDQDRRRITGWGVFAAFFAVLALLNLPQLANPPYWDEIVGLHNQALYLAKSNFDIVSLFTQEQGYHYGGSGIYRLGLMPWLYGFLYYTLPPLAVHVAGHLLNIAFIAGTAALLLVMLRRRCSEETSFLWTLAALADPIIAGRSAAQDQDTALAFFIMLTFFALFRRRPWAALLCALTACGIKFTGVILLIAGAAYGLWFLFYEIRDGAARKRNMLFTLVAALAALLVFQLNRLSTTAIDGVYDGRLYHFSWGEIIYHWIYYFPLLLAFSVILTAWGLYKYFSDAALRREAPVLLLVAVFIGGYWAAYFLSPMPRLPRYSCIVVMPLAFLGGFTVRPYCEKYLQYALILVFLCGAACWQGLFYRKFELLKEKTPNYNERSREFLDDIAKDRELCSFIEANCRDRLIVLKWPYVQMLGVPEFRYVKQALPRLRVIGNDVRYAPTAKQFDIAEMDMATLFVYSPRGFEFYHHPRLAPPAGAAVELAEDREKSFSGAMLYSGVRPLLPQKEEKK